jgi:hypothetical protein
VGILICGSRNDHTVRCSLGRATSPMAVASYTYDSLPAEVRHDLPDADRLTATLDWTEETSGRQPRSRPSKRRCEIVPLGHHAASAAHQQSRRSGTRTAAVSSGTRVLTSRGVGALFRRSSWAQTEKCSSGESGSP